MTKAVRLALGVCGLASVLYLMMETAKYQAAGEEYRRLAGELGSRLDGMEMWEEKLDTESGAEPDVRVKSDTAVDYLRRRNPDFAFWLMIPDTRIHYPVVEDKMHGYYLNHTFEGTKNSAGCLFVQEDGVLNPADNIIVYGHNMKDGSMFADLKKYIRKTYYEEHPELWLYEKNSWQRFAIFSCQIRRESDDAVYYSRFVGAEEKKKYLEEMCAGSLYETGIKPGCGDRLITLSTCYGSEKRMIVQAVLLCYTE